MAVIFMFWCWLCGILGLGCLVSPYVAKLIGRAIERHGFGIEWAVSEYKRRCEHVKRSQEGVASGHHS